MNNWKTTMKVICSVCKKDMGEKDGDGVEGVSHGLCPECLEQEEKKFAAWISVMDEMRGDE